MTPGATAYLLTDRFERLDRHELRHRRHHHFVGRVSELLLDGATGGIIVVLQTLIFLAAFLLAPKHGYLASRAKARAALEEPA